MAVLSQPEASRSNHFSGYSCLASGFPGSMKRPPLPQIGDSRADSSYAIFSERAATWSQPLTGPPCLLNERYDVIGRVRKLQQRTPGLECLRDLQNLESFDVEFSPDGLVLRETFYTNGGDVDACIANIYDESSRHLRSLGFNGAGTLTDITEFKYDTTGRSIKWIERDPAETTLRSGIDVYEEDLLKSSTILLAEGKKRTKLLEYSNKTLAKSVSEYYSQSGQCTERWISQYDVLGRLKETFALTADGKPLGDGRYTYEYDANGRESEVLGFNDWSDENVPNTVSRYEYTLDSSGNWIERREHHRFRSSSGWRTKVSKRTLTYYEAKEWCASRPHSPSGHP